MIDTNTLWLIKMIENSKMIFYSLFKIIKSKITLIYKLIKINLWENLKVLIVSIFEISSILLEISSNSTYK